MNKCTAFSFTPCAHKADDDAWKVLPKNSTYSSRSIKKYTSLLNESHNNEISSRNRQVTPPM